MTRQPPNNQSSSTIRKRLFSGLRWNGGTQVLQQFLNLGSSVILARLLVPEDFGLLAMASVFTGVVFLVLDMGLSSALIQAKELDNRQISSIFWMNVGVGVVMTLAGIASSGAIAQFYNTPEVQPVIMGLSCNFFIFSLSSTQQALLTRQMDFQGLGLRTLGGHVVGSIGAIALAFWGFGVWSLVGRIVITGLTSMVLLWAVSGWRPDWRFRLADVRQFMGFSSDVLGANFLGYIGRNADNFLIGRFVGVTQLGYYSLAYNLMRLPVQRFSQVLVQVLFPALSRLQENRSKVKQGWLRAVRLTGAVTIPLMLGLIAVAPQFVEVVYGEKWLPAVSVLQVLSVVGLVQSLTTLNSALLLSLGQTRLRLKLVVLSIALALASFVVGLPYGILGVATSFTVVTTATSAFALYKTLQCIDSNYLEYGRNLGGVLAAATGMEAVVLAIALGLPVAPGLILALTIPLGAIVYLLLLRIFAPGVIKEGIRILPERFTPGWLKVG